MGGGGRVSQVEERDVSQFTCLTKAALCCKIDWNGHLKPPEDIFTLARCANQTFQKIIMHHRHTLDHPLDSL